MTTDAAREAEIRATRVNHRRRWHQKDAQHEAVDEVVFLLRLLDAERAHADQARNDMIREGMTANTLRAALAEAASIMRAHRKHEGDLAREYSKITVGLLHEVQREADAWLEKHGGK